MAKNEILCSLGKTPYFCRPFLKTQSYCPVKPLKEYKIPFLGLKVGKHSFRFSLDEKFFDCFELSQIHKSAINADVNLEKQASMMLVDFDLQGTIQLTCDRCGDEYDQPIVFKQHLVVKFGEETGDDTDDLYILGPREHELDLSQFLYEYAHLAIPVRHLHPSEEFCNQDSLKALAKYRTAETGDTKWAQLKDLNFEEPDETTDFDSDEEE